MRGFSVKLKFMVHNDFPMQVDRSGQCAAPQRHLWLIKVWFSASTFVVKIATFAKPENVVAHRLITAAIGLLMLNFIIFLML